MSTNKDEIKKAIETRFIITKFELPKDYPGQQKKRNLRAYAPVYQQSVTKPQGGKVESVESKYKIDG